MKQGVERALLSFRNIERASASEAWKQLNPVFNAVFCRVPMLGAPAEALAGCTR